MKRERKKNRVPFSILKNEMDGRLIALDSISMKFNQIYQTYSKHLLTKSINSGSLHRSTCANGFVPGLRLRFLEFVMHLGFPRESKKRRRRDA